MIQGADRQRVTNLAGTAVDVLDAELAVLNDAIATVSQVSTPATGSNGTQFTFKNAAGTAISTARRIEAWLSDANGVPVTAITSLATLTNGSLVQLVAGQVAMAVPTAAGLLGITFTGTAATRYISFALPGGKILTSAAIVIN